jgi:hypothetical protein
MSIENLIFIKLSVYHLSIVSGRTGSLFHLEAQNMVWPYTKFKNEANVSR